MTLALGLMSGTSLDGVDAALVRFADGGAGIELLAFATVPYDPPFRDQLLDVMTRGTARDVALMHVALGERFAEAAERVLADAGVAAGALEFVASHGQTVWHEPGVATLQLGDPAPIAERLGVRIVSDFRARDVAAGGQGAPLVPVADVLLFGAEQGCRVLLNIGGIANVTWVPRRGMFDGVVAFDTGPGVAVLDAVVRQTRGDPYDRDGERAAAGTAHSAVVDELLDHPWFDRPPPRSTGREQFGDALAERIVTAVEDPDDAIATALELTARSIAGQLARWLPAEDADVVVSGGGARNPTLLRRLGEVLPRPVRPFDDLFFDGDAKEAVAFALLGKLTLEGKPGNVPAATGARGPRVLGRITPP